MSRYRCEGMPHAFGQPDGGFKVCRNCGAVYVVNINDQIVNTEPVLDHRGREIGRRLLGSAELEGGEG